MGVTPGYLWSSAPAEAAGHGEPGSWGPVMLVGVINGLLQPFSTAGVAECRTAGLDGRLPVLKLRTRHSPLLWSGWDRIRGEDAMALVKRQET